MPRWLLLPHGHRNADTPVPRGNVLKRRHIVRFGRIVRLVRRGSLHGRGQHIGDGKPVHGGLLLRDADVVGHVHGGLFLPAGFIFADALWRGLLLERRRVCVRVVHGRLLHGDGKHDGDCEPLRRRLFLRERNDGVVDASRVPGGLLVRRRSGDWHDKSVPGQHLLRRWRDRDDVGRMRCVRRRVVDRRTVWPVGMRAAISRRVGGYGRCCRLVRKPWMLVHDFVRGLKLLLGDFFGHVVQLSFSARLWCCVDLDTILDVVFICNRDAYSWHGGFLHVRAPRYARDALDDGRTNNDDNELHRMVHADADCDDRLQDKLGRRECVQTDGQPRAHWLVCHASVPHCVRNDAILYGHAVTRLDSRDGDCNAKYGDDGDILIHDTSGDL